ncbi:MAG: tetratricopeptide repeat protein [Methanomassiliicoccaceae archaeon]|jgi:tetratricopeptide (TPR) repeat protein|nr:tetratricopeptide repeat protein [Methanomassiliicoccaceae archaeon]
MQRSEPILTDPDDVRIWNKIDGIDPKEKKKRREQDKLSVLAVIDDALTATKHMHSAVLVKILRKAAHEEVGDLENVAIKVLDMCRPGDMFPIMEAADIVLKDGNLDISRSLMKRMVNVPDTAFKEYLDGMLATRAGDKGKAVKHLIRSNAIDQSFVRTYDLLISMDPGKGWDVLRNIPIIMNGGRPLPVRTDDKELLELQEIYDGWYNGERGMARKRLEASNGYSSGHLDFLLAAARVSGDVEEYDTSLALYDRILSQYPNIDSIVVEKANILTAVGRRSDALALLDALDKGNMRNRNVTESMLRALASKSTEKEFSMCSKDFLRSEHGDKRGYLLVCRLMASIGMNNEAGNILQTLLPLFPDDLDIHLANAGNEVGLGRDTAAMKAADKIVKLSPKTADGYCIRSQIHLRYGRVRSALKDAERALKCDPAHVDSLNVMKAIRKHTRSYDDVLEVCRRILIIDPSNTDATKDMAYALDMLGKRQEAIEEYRNALRLKKDRRMLAAILSTLIESERFDEAAGIAKEFIGAYGKDHELWYLKGNAEYRSSDFTGAAASYGKALETRPHDARLWHSKGMAEEMAGLYKEAESSYDRAVLIDLNNPEFWLSKAVAQEKHGDTKGAVISLNRVISESPDNVYALVRKARILVNSGQTREAMYFLDHALKVDGRNIKIMEIKKNIYRRDGDPDGVIDTCRAILAVDRKNIDALTDMAETYQRMGKHDEALKVLSNVSSDLGEVGVLMMKKHSARLNGNTEVEIEACRAILRIEPSRAVKLELAGALIRNGDHGDAMKVYDEIQKNDPKDAEVIMLRGKLRAIMGDGSSAVALYQEAVLENPNDCGTLNELANALCDSGEYGEAMNMISRAIEISPEMPECHLTRSKIYLAKNDTRGALASLNHALDHVSESGEIHLRIGDIHNRRGDHGQALASYDSAIRNGLDTGDTYHKRGAVQEKLGQREAAKKSYSVSIAKDRNSIRSLERIGSMQLEDGEYAVAGKNLDAALDVDPFDVPALLSRARLYVKEGNKKKALPIYRALSNRDDCTDAVVEEMNALLEDGEEPPEEVRPEPVKARPEPKARPEARTKDIEHDIPAGADAGSTYDLAMMALERAYKLGGAISDDKMLSSLGIKGEKRTAVLNYLSSIDEYGDINVRSKEFERMERLSKNVILAEHLEDIDSNPLIGIPAAFMSSTAETIDDAKKLIAYIYKVMNDDSEPMVFSNEVRDAVAEASEMSGDISTYNIMRLFNVGVHTAHTISRLSKMNKKGPDMHI